MANNLASMEFILVVWWTILAMISCSLQIWDTKVATLFMMFISVMMNTMSWFIRESSYKLSSFLCWAESELGFFLFTEKKEKQLRKVSIDWKPSKIFLLRLLKKGNILFSWLLALTIEFLIFNHCLAMSLKIAMWWGVSCLEYCLSSSDRMAYCLRSKEIQR